MNWFIGILLGVTLMFVGAPYWAAVMGMIAVVAYENWKDSERRRRARESYDAVLRNVIELRAWLAEHEHDGNEELMKVKRDILSTDLEFLETHREARYKKWMD